jgi:hypothetical protein
VFQYHLKTVKESFAIQFCTIWSTLRIPSVVYGLFKTEFIVDMSKSGILYIGRRTDILMGNTKFQYKDRMILFKQESSSKKPEVRKKAGYIGRAGKILRWLSNLYGI